MHKQISIAPHTVDIWQISLPDFSSEEQALFSLLSPDETQRALRFHFSLHKQRFIITRGLLRKTLSLYTGITPNKISFFYGPHGKPYLQDNKLKLQFNVSHSADCAIFAFTIHQEIGVDIEKIQPSFNDAVAKRFFSPPEYAELLQLPLAEQAQGFYQLWSRKEALIKAAGLGVFIPLTDFTIALAQAKQTVALTYQAQHYHFHVENLTVSDGYQAAIASVEPINQLIYK